MIVDIPGAAVDIAAGSVLLMKGAASAEGADISVT
jgi:hypothetical protein